MAPFDYLSDFAKPLLVIAGSSDEFSDGRKLKELVRPPNGSFELLPGVDHFYIGQELRVGGLVVEFMQRLQREAKI